MPGARVAAGGRPVIGGEAPRRAPTPESPSAARRRAREVALQVLYAIDLGTDRPRRRGEASPAEPAAGPAVGPSVANPRGATAPDPDVVFDAVAAHFEMPGAARRFAREIASGVRAEIEAIDAHVSACSRNWRIDRMAAVDRNILRLAAWELIYTDTPTPVVLDEAIDLARRFADDPSPAFVNGILDALARAVRGAS